MFITSSLPPIFVDTATQLQDLLGQLANLPVSPPSLYINLEGINLSRAGTISILTPYAPPLNMVYLIDVFKLGTEAFSTTNVDNISLKTVLESPTIPKIFFDVRNDSDALHHHYGIHLDCIQDVQLMENATRPYTKKFVTGLQRCIENDIKASRSWTAIKQASKPLFAPEHGGDFAVFNTRPLAQALVDYCAVDVVLLPQLWERYNMKLQQPKFAGWRAKVEQATKARIME